LDELDRQGLGHAEIPHLGFRISDSPDAALTLPWSNLDTLVTVFNKPVTAVTDDLQITGVADGFVSITPSDLDLSQSNVARWSWETPLEANHYELQLADTIQAFGSPLDGDGAGLLPSGNGTAGGDLQFAIRVLPGDTDRDGTVGISDLSAMRDASGRTIGSDEYSLFADTNGSGRATVVDLSPLRRHFGLTLPGIEALPANASPPAADPTPAPTQALDRLMDAGDAVAAEDPWDLPPIDDLDEIVRDVQTTKGDDSIRTARQAIFIA
jgi:hypothetical protein